jgi:hypothetical protein
MATKEEFAKFMVTLAAALPRYAPNTGSHEILGVWYAELGHLSIDALRAAYKKAVRSSDGFPSMRQILELCGESQTDQDKGREVAERIFAGLSKFGDMNGPSGIEKWDKQIAPYLGPIGIEVVKMNGGWNYLCETVTTKDATTWKAQWRGLAETLARKGGLGDAPTFDSLPPNDAIKALAEKAAF